MIAPTLSERLRAKAWQSARYKGGRGQKAHDHVCWEAAAEIERQAAEIARLEAQLAGKSAPSGFLGEP